MKRKFLIVAGIITIALIGASCTQYRLYPIYPPATDNNYCTVTLIFSDDDTETPVIEKGNSFTIPINNRTKDGYTFGWWVDSEKNKYLPGDSILITDDITFTAEWIKDDKAVSSSDGTDFNSIADAASSASDGTSIILTDNTSTGGLKFPNAQYASEGIDFDLNGHSMLITSSVGSSSTETNGMQLLRGNNVTFRDGFITSDYENCLVLIQNYSNLLLSNVILSPGPNTIELLGINNGIVTVENGTTIMPIEGAPYTADIYYWPSNSYTDEVGLIVRTSDVVINGPLLISHDGTEQAKENFADNIVVIIPAGYENEMNQIIDFQIPGYKYDWEPCARPGYETGYKQMIFTAL